MLLRLGPHRLRRRRPSPLLLCMINAVHLRRGVVRRAMLLRLLLGANSCKLDARCAVSYAARLLQLARLLLWLRRGGPRIRGVTVHVRGVGSAAVLLDAAVGRLVGWAVGKVLGDGEEAACKQQQEAWLWACCGQIEGRTIEMCQGCTCLLHCPRCPGSPSRAPLTVGCSTAATAQVCVQHGRTVGQDALSTSISHHYRPIFKRKPA